MSLFEIALAYHQRGDYENALLHYDQALSAQPQDFQALSNKGAALQKLRRFDEALSSYDAAIALTKKHAAIFNNRGVTLQELHRLGDAINDFDAAVALEPRYADAYVNRGFVHHLRRDFDLAIQDYKTAIEIAPNFSAAHFNLSLSQLAVGDYANGWRNHEWRWQAVPDTPARVFPDHQPLWVGQDIAGKTVFLYAEQGLGDTLQFCRYVELVHQRGAQIILEVPQELRVLFAQMKGVDRLITYGEEIGAFDFQCPLMSLPLVFGTELGTIPCSSSYLCADADKSMYWKQRLSVYSRLKVGIVWSGGFRLDQPKLWGVNNRRNLAIDHLKQFESINADFFSLQKGEGAEAELAVFSEQTLSGPMLHNFVNEFKDFSDTAAFIDNLDLVISVDTSTAHLAAALGKPVWILNRFDACWRWLKNRSDSPWYESVRLYRQSEDGNWQSLMREVAADLRRFISSRSSS